MSGEDTVLFFEDKSNSNLELIIAKIIIEAQNAGDSTRCEFLLNRMVGKVKEQHEHAIVGSMHSAVVDMIIQIEKDNANGGQNNGKTRLQTNGEKISTKEKCIEENSRKEIVSTQEEVDE
jgi:hypothetical protein